MRVLLVSDDSNLVFVLHYGLRKAGFAVIPASRAEAITCLHQASPAALIVDDSGPADSGLPTLRRLTAELSAPYILLTPREDVNASELPAGRVAVLWKPFSLADLVQHLRVIGQRAGGVGTESPDSQDLTSEGAVH